MTVLGSVLLLCVLRAAKEFMLFRPSSLPRLLAILGKSKLQSFSVWLACVVPNLYLTYPSCSVPLPLPSLTSPISLYLPCSNDINLSVSILCIDSTYTYVLYMYILIYKYTLDGPYLLHTMQVAHSTTTVRMTLKSPDT